VVVEEAAVVVHYPDHRRSVVPVVASETLYHHLHSLVVEEGVEAEHFHTKKPFAADMEILVDGYHMIH